MDVDSDELDEFKVKTNSDYEEDKMSRESSEDKSFKQKVQLTLEDDYEDIDRQPFINALNHLKQNHVIEEEVKDEEMNQTQFMTPKPQTYQSKVHFRVDSKSKQDRDSTVNYDQSLLTQNNQQSTAKNLMRKGTTESSFSTVNITDQK